MSYKHFYRALLLRLIVIILLSAGATYLYFIVQAFVLSLLFLILLAGAVWNIIWYFNRINRWIASFLLGIENDDTTLKTPSKTGNRAIDDVYLGTERLNEMYKKTKIDITTQEQYFRSVIDQSATGLFSVNEKGRVLNINPAATKLTKLNDHHHVNALATLDKVLPAFIMESDIHLKDQSAIFENQFGQKLLFKLSSLKTPTERITLVAVSDITKELDVREIDAWIKLARTLSHEIMNNIAPITSLSKLILGYFTNQNSILKPDDVDEGTIANTVKGLRVIEERGLGLINFVENYRKFTKLPVPHYNEVNLRALIESNLMAAGAYDGFNNITIQKVMLNDILVSTDEKLLSQVVLNLLKNASEALTLENPLNPIIHLHLFETTTGACIEITNNGPLIPHEIRQQIFVPFYTAKENGSGIGLSLSKQIMLQMGGDIVLSTSREGKTIFKIVINSGTPAQVRV